MNLGTLARVFGSYMQISQCMHCKRVDVCRFNVCYRCYARGLRDYPTTVSQRSKRP